MLEDFEAACDRLSQAIDSAQYERIRWSRTEGPMLDHLVELVRGAIRDIVISDGLGENANEVFAMYRPPGARISHCSFRALRCRATRRLARRHASLGRQFHRSDVRQPLISYGRRSSKSKQVRTFRLSALRLACADRILSKILPDRRHPCARMIALPQRGPPAPRVRIV